VNDIEDSLLHQEMRDEQLKRVQKDSKRSGGGNADRGKGDLEEGAEAARPPRVLVRGVGPAGFSAIFSGGGSGGGGGGDEASTISLSGQMVRGTGVVVWWTGSIPARPWNCPNAAYNTSTTCVVGPWYVKSSRPPISDFLCCFSFKIMNKLHG